MLQFSPTVYSITTRLTSRLLWRLHTSLMSNAATVSNVNVKEIASSILTSNIQRTAFNQLKTKLCTDLDTKSAVTSKIKDAEDVHDLLQVIKEPLLTQAQIINALHTITLWVNENNNRESSAAIDKSIHSEKWNVPSTNTTDLSQYYDLSTAQMIKEIKKLATEQNRDVKLLNYFYQNIVAYSQELPPAACSSLMFSMSRIYYSDERLLKKICSDLIWHLTNRSVICATVLVSIIKSAAIIRYSNDTFLHHVCDDIIRFKDYPKYSNHQIASVLLSLAMLNHQSENLDKVIMLYGPELSCGTLGHSGWLDVVWSLVILQRVELSQITSVLNKSFIKKLMFYDAKKRISYQLKLLNIDSYARYALEGYNESSIAPMLVSYTVAKQSKQKKLYVTALEDTLKNFLPSPDHYKVNIDTHMGFFLDATLSMDSNMTFVTCSEDVNEGIVKIGILLLDYYDMYLGSKRESGLIKLYIKLLTCTNYRVICVPYQNFAVEDKIEKRVSYLKRQIWVKLNEPV